jgi:hypothetical protein
MARTSRTSRSVSGDAPNARDIYRFQRDEFLEDYWDYGSSGDAEHATFCGMNRSGKTTLAFELLGRSTRMDPEMGSDESRIAVALVMKPQDRTPEQWGKKLGYKRIDTWPPPVTGVRRKYNIGKQPPGYLVWPKLGDLRTDNVKLRKLFYKVLAESYAQAGSKKHAQERIIFADEVIGLQRISNADYPIKSALDDLYERGAGMGIGLWAALQKPFNAPTNAYENSIHLFIWRSNDKRNRKRYEEIGGIDADALDGIVSTLNGRDCLYINRALTEDQAEYYVIGQD